MDNCKFCADIQFIKALDKKFRKENPGLKTEWKAGYFRLRWRPGFKWRASVCSSARYPLNYCPECGKPISRKAERKAIQT